MPSCRKCGAVVVPPAAYCAACGARVAPVATQTTQHGADVVFTHVLHPYIAIRKEKAPIATRDMYAHDGVVQRVNAFLAVKITDGVGTMWCAYVFAAVALISFPDAIRGGTPTIISWIAQTFLQLVLLSIIIVGQKVSSAASDQRAQATYYDAEAVLHEALQIQEHLAAQDGLLSQLVDGLSPRAST